MSPTVPGVSPPREPPVYRPFAALALGSAVLGGTPLGALLLWRLHGGAVSGSGPVVPEWVLLHAHLQLFGFFGALILGVAHHLVPRFAGQPVARSPLAPWLVGLMGAALILRPVGAATGARAWVLAGVLLQVLAFGLFAGWLWRRLARPGLTATRRHLVASTAWLALALSVEAWARWRAPGLEPDPAWMRVVHLVAFYGGVTGWILGVALRAGPMFVPRWGVPAGLARVLPGLAAAGVLLAAMGEVGGWPTARGIVLAWIGEAVVLGTIAVVALTGGAARRARGALPLLARGGPETWLFRVSLLSGSLGAVGSVGAAVLAWWEIPLSLLADALRHLVTVGFATAMVLAMAFRLIPVLEGVPLPWPRLRIVALGAIVAAVLLRTGEVLADYGWTGVLPWVPLSGLLVWIALACVAATFIGAVHARTR